MKRILFIATTIIAPFLNAESINAEKQNNSAADDFLNFQTKKFENKSILAQPVSADEVKKLVRAGTKIELAETIPLALKKNLGLSISRTNHAGTQESLEIAKADFDPTVSVSSNYTNTGTPYLRNQNHGSSTQSWTNEVAVSKKFKTGTEAKVYADFNRQYNVGTEPDPASGAAVGVEISQPLLKNFGSEINLASVVRAQKNITQSSLDLRKTTLDLIHDTELAYWNLSASYALVFARLSSLRYAEFVLEQAKKKRSLKSATKEEVLRAEADVASRRVSLVSAKQSVQDADDALRKLLGQDGTGTFEVYEVAALLNDIQSEMPEFQTWIKQVRAFDIDAQIKQLEREKAELDIKIAENNDKPSLDLVLGAEASGRESSPHYAVGGIVDRSGYNLSAGVRFSMPIGFRAEKAALRQAQRSRESAQISIAQAEQNAMFSARAAWRSEEAARERLDASKTSFRMQYEAFEAQIAKYDVGACSITDVLSAQDNLDSARLDLIQAAYDVATARAKIHRLDGRILSDYGYIWEE